MPSSNRTALAEAERRIAEAKRKRETALILSDLGLEVLPENVCRLAQLRTLYLNDNRLTRLPESIGRLAQLRRLSLLGNRLIQLPDALGTFPLGVASPKSQPIDSIAEIDWPARTVEETSP